MTFVRKSNSSKVSLCLSKLCSSTSPVGGQSSLHPVWFWPQHCTGTRGHVHLTAGLSSSGGKASYSFQRHFPLLSLFTGSSSTSPLPGGSPQFICSCWQQYISGSTKTWKYQSWSYDGAISLTSCAGQFKEVPFLVGGWALHFSFKVTLLSSSS